MTACGSKEEKASVGVIATPLDSYLAVKDALVSTNGIEAQKAAKAFLKVNNNVSLSKWIDAIAASSDAATQRIAFEMLSEEMYKIVKAEGTDTPLYKQYCPMAFNNKGAYWLATEKEVNNPYFGDVMLHCGSVQETINQ